MFDKNALVTSASEAVQFLKKEIAAVGVDNFDCRNTPSDEHFLVIKAYLVNAIDSKQSEPILELDMGHRPEQNLCFLDAVGVQGKYKGTGLGGAVIKAALGAVHEASAYVVLLRDVVADGASFWSHYGAVPVKEPTPLAYKIQSVLEGPDTKLSQFDRDIFEAAREIARAAPFQGWRALSQVDELSAEGKQVRHEIFKSFLETIVDGGLKLHEAMVLFPAEKSTRKILEKRLGKIPVFLRPAEREPYNIEDILSKAPAIILPAPVREPPVLREAVPAHRHS